MPLRDVRHQAAVIDRGRIMVVQVVLPSGRAFWLLPGGGREATDDSGEACVAREVREESGLDVSVDAILSDLPAHPDDTRYARWRTYLCSVRGGEVRAGVADGSARIARVEWLPLDNEASWPPEVHNDRFLYSQLNRIAAQLREKQGG